MPKQIMNWIRHVRSAGWLAGVTLFARAAQDGQPPADQTQNTVAIIIVIAAIALPLLMGGGFALMTWLISLGTPTPLVAVDQKRIIKREILPEGAHMPPPSSRPIMLALGMTLICIGILLRGVAIALSPDFNVPIILVIGALITFLALLGWIRDDLRAAKGH
ncbi:MAG TPA: hypothetical protein VFF70_08695 [Anaerolineae bacterium]|nr:hypothetical protein [Anaerolineae bacterium]